MARSKKAEPAKTQTDKDIVEEKYKNAECREARIGLFHICVNSDDIMEPIHSGFAKNESDAWKKAAHECY